VQAANKSKEEGGRIKEKVTGEMKDEVKNEV
jgi:hypothetical protein